jgi:hypothetical protein
MEELFVIIGMLSYIIFTLYKLDKKPPMMISCNCFNDLSHDEMVRVKQMYCEMRKEQSDKEEKDEEEDGVEVKKED